MRGIVQSVLTFTVLCGFYLILAGEVSTVEIVAMTVCALLGSGLALGLSLVARVHLAPRPPPRAILRPFAALVPEFLAVARLLIGVSVRGGNRHEGGFVRQPCRSGDDSPREAGRRAVNLIGLSLAPRTFLVRDEAPRSSLLLHGFPPKPAAPDESWPA